MNPGGRRRLQGRAIRGQPVVTDAPHIRFYAGVPLMYRGQAIGTLCVFDIKPRTLDAKQLEELRFWPHR